MKVLVIKIEGGIPYDFRLIAAEDQEDARTKCEEAVSDMCSEEDLAGVETESGETWRDYVMVGSRLDIDDSTEIYFMEADNRDRT